MPRALFPWAPLCICARIGHNALARNPSPRIEISVSSEWHLCAADLCEPRMSVDCLKRKDIRFYDGIWSKCILCRLFCGAVWLRSDCHCVLVLCSICSEHGNDSIVGRLFVPTIIMTQMFMWNYLLPAVASLMRPTSNRWKCSQIWVMNGLIGCKAASAHTFEFNENLQLEPIEETVRIVNRYSWPIGLLEIVLFHTFHRIQIKIKHPNERFQ